MPVFEFQYRREQRIDFSVTADSKEKAEEIANGLINTFNLDSPDDMSDDDGELELLDSGHLHNNLLCNEFKFIKTS